VTLVAPRMRAAPAPAAAPGPGLLAMWTALTTVYLVWGSTYLAIRVVVDSVPPLLAMGVRFLVAGLLLAAFLLARRGRRALRVDRRQLAGAGVVGLLLLLGGNGGVAVAEQTVPSGIAALLVAATPLWLVLLRTAARDRPRPVSLLGTVVGFLGIAVLVRPGASLGEDVQTWGLVTVVAAAGSWALGSFLSPRLPMPGDAFVATTWQMVVGGGVMVAVGAAATTVTRPHVSTPSPSEAPGRTRTAMPRKPTNVPSRLTGRGRSRAAVRSSTSHSGVAATSRAAMPEGTVCSATATPPLPPSSSSSPTTPAPAS